ncbi:MAG TPA: MFS transporter [Caulobacteraceae bacterium]
MADVAAAGDHEVHEAFGPPLSGLEAGAAIALGVLSLLLAGVLPILLAALVDEHRLDARGIGLAAMLEALTMGAATALASALLKPERLRIIGVVAAVALTAIDLATLVVHGDGVFLVRGLAGIPEGLLLWICIGMIARTVTPERWAGVLLTALTLAQFLASTLCAVLIVPRFHANGGFAFVAVVSLLAAPISLMIPDRYADLPAAEGASFPLPARGWVALAAMLLIGAATGAVGIYIVPLAHQAGLSSETGGVANSVSLAAQVAGGVAAIAIAGRARYFHVFLAGTITFLITWGVYGFTQPAWLFVAVSGLYGFMLLLIGPFFVPMAIEADPSRRTAVQVGAAQILGGALGPLLAILSVSDANARGVLFLGGGLVLSGLALVAWLHFTAKEA